MTPTEPVGHGIGRSRGGLSSKIHAGVDGRGRQLSVVITSGQRNNGAMLQVVLDDIHVPRVSPGGARSRPDAVLADRGYETTVIRRDLRKRGIVGSSSKT